MKVLLLQDIKGLGKRMDIKEVPNGYARNFLIAKKLAIPADKSALYAKAETEIKEKALINKYQIWAEKLKSETLEFKVKTGKKGELFGSIGADKIERELEKRGYADFQIIFAQSIKTTGEHFIDVKFGRGIRSRVKIIVLSDNL